MSTCFSCFCLLLRLSIDTMYRDQGVAFDVNIYTRGIGYDGNK